MARTSFVANPAKIKVIGLGGGGSNAVTRMVRENIQGVEFIAMNTDAQALAVCEAPVCVQLGPKLTRGLGAGGDHHVGAKAAEENRDELREIVTGADMVFLTAGMGGGTGTGSIRWWPRLPSKRRADHRRGHQALRFRRRAPHGDGGRRYRKPDR